MTPAELLYLVGAEFLVVFSNGSWCPPTLFLANLVPGICSHTLLVQHQVSNGYKNVTDCSC